MDINTLKLLTRREQTIAACAALGGVAAGMTATYGIMRKQLRESQHWADTFQKEVGELTDIVGAQADEIEHLERFKRDDYISDEELEAESPQIVESRGIDSRDILDLHPDNAERVFPTEDKPALADLAKKVDLELGRELAANLDYGNPDAEQTEFDHGYTPEEIQAIQEVIAEEEAQEPEYEGFVPGNVFENEPDPSEYVNQDWTPEWDYVKEMPIRIHLQRQGKPYIIHSDEFTQNETGYNQQHLTYYEGDEVLVDDRDVPIDVKDALVGSENLSRFGHGSGNPDTLFIRNEKMQAELAIERSPGKFAHEVLGGELEHSETKHYRSSRRFDDE